jgi:DNA primase large subunit
MKGSDVIQRLSPYIKYPFMVSLNEYMRKLYGSSVPITHIIEHCESGYVERAVIRVRSALKDLEYIPSTSESIELSAFYIGLILTSALGKWYFRKYIDYESRRSYEYLLGDSEDNIVKVANSLGVQVEFLGSPNDKCGERVVVGTDLTTSKPIIHCFQFRVPITTYLRGISKLATEPKWKLVNQYLKNGYVYLGKREISRLLQEFIKYKLLDTVPDLSNTRFEGYVNEVLERLRSEFPTQLRPVEETVEKSSESPQQVVNEAFPPCIKVLVDMLKRNENLSHHQRFALATFLINVGVDIEEIVNLFRYAPDFNERMTRYQLEHLAGLRGSKRKYLTYSCDKMKSLGICVANCGVKSPLTYYKKMVKKFKDEVRK